MQLFSTTKEVGFLEKNATEKTNVKLASCARLSENSENWSTEIQKAIFETVPALSKTTIFVEL
jgi:hypothetical protein